MIAFRLIQILIAVIAVIAFICYFFYVSKTDSECNAPQSLMIESFMVKNQRRTRCVKGSD